MSDPIKVTLSGNSTPLLPNPFAPAFMGNTQSVPLNSLVEADCRLAIEQGKGLTNSQGAVVLGLLGELRARLDEHIAKSTKAVSMLLDASARLAEAEARAVRAEVLLDCLGKMTRAAVELREAVLCAEVDLGDDWVDADLVKNGHELFRAANVAVREAMKDNGGVCSLLDKSVSSGGRFNMGCETKDESDAARAAVEGAQ